MGVKYIFVTGGVVSGLGKGITAASLGRLLKERGYKVTCQKFDPYINVDPGTMSPYQHGEVFVTDDGAETDLDLGHYERFIDENLTVNSNVTSGKVYWSVIQKERQGAYLGSTVQVIPHVTNEIKDRMRRAAKDRDADVIITEIGGTVGDIESLPFLEAVRQMVSDEARDDCMVIHVTLIPYISGSNELKSKPTQHSVKELRSIGIQPDVLVCRSEQPIPQDMKDKIALFCNVRPEDVIQNLTADTLYEVPLMLEEEGLAEVVCERLHLDAPKSDLADWRSLVDRIKHLKKEVTVGIVGKYIELPDAYISIVEALNHGGFENDSKVDIRWISAEELEQNPVAPYFEGCDGIIIPGGFGDRGIEGKILASQYCRENNIPLFGICLGMQTMAIEYARNVLHLPECNSSEFDKACENPIIDLMLDQMEVEDIGGTMRLGLYPCKLKEGSRAEEIYADELVYERHRHRYEFNNVYRKPMEETGLIFSGLSPDDKLVEIIEYPANDWYMGVQFHPELKSRPNRAQPLFRDFIGACVQYHEKNNK